MALNVKNRVKYVREARGMPREELAKLVGTTDLTLEAVEDTQWNCSTRTALLISVALDCDIKDLFYLGE